MDPFESKLPRVAVTVRKLWEMFRDDVDASAGSSGRRPLLPVSGVQDGGLLRHRRHLRHADRLPIGAHGVIFEAVHLKST